MMQETVEVCQIYCTMIGGLFGGPLPAPFAAMLFVPYDEMRPPPTGFNPVVLLVTRST